MKGRELLRGYAKELVCVYEKMQKFRDEEEGEEVGG